MRHCVVRRRQQQQEKMQGKTSDCSGCVAHLHHVGEVITQGTPSIIHIDKNPFKIGRLGCDENINKPTVSRQAAIFDIVDSPSATWDIKITEPAQCSVGLFVNWQHVKEQTLHDGDLIGFGLAGVLAYESTTTRKLLPHGASVDAVKGARSEYVYKFTKGCVLTTLREKRGWREEEMSSYQLSAVTNAQRLDHNSGSNVRPPALSRAPTQLAPQRSSSNLPSPSATVSGLPTSPESVSIKPEPNSPTETMSSQSEFSQSQGDYMNSSSLSTRFNLNAYTKLPANPCDWSVDDVVAYISEALPTKYHPETYTKTFEEQGVDGEILLSLTEQDMKDDLLMTKLGVRRRLTMLIRELRKHSGALSSAQAASMSSGGDDASATQISSEFSASQMGTQMSDSGSEAHTDQSSTHNTSADSIKEEPKQEEENQTNKEGPQEKGGENHAIEQVQKEEDKERAEEVRVEEGDKEEERKEDTREEIGGARQRENPEEGTKEEDETIEKVPTKNEEPKEKEEDNQKGDATDENPESAPIMEEVVQAKRRAKGEEEEEEEEQLPGKEQEEGKRQEQSIEGGEDEHEGTRSMDVELGSAVEETDGVDQVPVGDAVEDGGGDSDTNEGGFKRLRRGERKAADDEEVDETKAKEESIEEEQPVMASHKEQKAEDDEEEQREESQQAEGMDIGGDEKKGDVKEEETKEEDVSDAPKSSKRQLVEGEDEDDSATKPGFKRLRKGTGDEAEGDGEDSQESEEENHQKRKRNPFIDDEAGVDGGEGEDEEVDEAEEAQEGEEEEDEEAAGEEKNTQEAEESKTINEAGEQETHEEVGAEQVGVEVEGEESKEKQEAIEEVEGTKAEEGTKEEEAAKEDEGATEEAEVGESIIEEEEAKKVEEGGKEEEEEAKAEEEEATEEAQEVEEGADIVEQNRATSQPMEVEEGNNQESNADEVNINAEVLAPYLYPNKRPEVTAPLTRMMPDEALNPELVLPHVLKQPEAVLPPSQEPSAMDISHIVGLANLVRKDDEGDGNEIPAVAETEHNVRTDPIEYQAPYVPAPASGVMPAESIISSILEQQQYTLIEEHETPEQLNIPLKIHQRQALAWMLGREKSKTRCGILADEMGLGKTMTALSLILANPYRQKIVAMDKKDAVSQLNNNLDKTWYHLINRNRLVGKKLTETKIQELASDYVAVMKSSLDLFSIHLKITKRVYLSRKHFLADLKIASENFKKYFTSKNNAPYANYAAGLLVAAEAHLVLMQKELIELEAAIDPSTLPPPKRKHPTLVVCTKSLLEQWKEEATKRTKPNTFKTYIHHGPARTKKYRDLYNYDIVISSYAIISSEFTPQHKGDTTPVTHGAIHKVKWHRVILDEAHTIKNQKARQSKACCNLKAKYRWALTGTPIQNSLEDLYSLFLFLRFSPYDDYERFRVSIVNCLAMPDLTTAFKIINTIISEVLINRTKKTMLNGRPLLELPPKNISEKRVAFSTAEQDFYNAFYAKAQFDYYVRQGTVMMHLKHIIALIIRLRQACNHPILVLASETYRQMMRGSSVPALTLSQDLELCPLCESTFEDPVEAPCRHRFCRECIEHAISVLLKCPECHIELTSDKLRKAGSGSGTAKPGISCTLPSGIKIRSSTKIDSLTSALQEQFSREPRSKALIFSNFTAFLSLVEIRLKELNMKFVRLDGTMSLPQRKRAINDFQVFGENEHNLFLISLKAGGLGLNLIEANYVYLLDPWWNPFAEDQAIDRCHRMGQTKVVTVTKLTVQGTIEDRMLELQDQKRVIAEGALGRRQGLINKKLTVDDLKSLFS